MCRPSALAPPLCTRGWPPARCTARWRWRRRRRSPQGRATTWPGEISSGLASCGLSAITSASGTSNSSEICAGGASGAGGREGACGMGRGERSSWQATVWRRGRHPRQRAVAAAARQRHPGSARVELALYSESPFLTGCWQRRAAAGGSRGGRRWAGWSAQVQGWQEVAASFPWRRRRRRRRQRGGARSGQQAARSATLCFARGRNLQARGAKGSKKPAGGRPSGGGQEEKQQTPCPAAATARCEHSDELESHPQNSGARGRRPAPASRWNACGRTATAAADYRDGAWSGAHACEDFV